jgi:phage terminase small subunit
MAGPGTPANLKKRGPKTDVLNARRQAFLEAYLLEPNATKAALAAGFSAKSAHAQGIQLLKSPLIKAKLDELRAEAANKFQITRDRVLKEFARIAFADIREFYDENGRLKSVAELGEDAAAVLASVEVDELFAANLGGGMIQVGETKKVKLHNKLAALEALGKHLGLFEADNKQKQPLAIVDLSGLSAVELAKLIP